MKQVQSLAVLATLIFASCNVVELQEPQDKEPSFAAADDEITNVDFTIAAPTIIREQSTRAYYYEDEKGNGSYLWAESDTLAVYPEKGGQVYFVIGEGGAGSKTASFDGGGWAFKAGMTYYSYFPFIPDYYLDRQSIPVSYKGQVQTGKESMEHTSRFLYSYSGATSAQSGTLHFAYHQLGCVINPEISERVGKFVELSIVTEDKIIAETGHFNLFMPDVSSVAITGDEMTDRLSIRLEDFEIAQGETANIYMAAPPIPIGGKPLSILLTENNGKVWTCEKSSISSDFGKNQIRTLTCNTWKQTGIGVGEASKAAIENALAELSGNDEINVVNVAAVPDGDLELVIPTVSDSREVSLTFPEQTESEVKLTISVSDESQAPAKLNLTAPDNSSLNILTPTTTVKLDGKNYEKVSAATAVNTLVIGNEVEVRKLELIRGGLHVYGKVEVLDLSQLDTTGEAIDIVNEGQIGKVVGYGEVSSKVHIYDGKGNEMTVDDKGYLVYGWLEDNILDPVFRQYCLDNFDANGDGHLTRNEAKAVSEITVNTDNIQTLQGIEYFKNLTYISCCGTYSWDDQQGAICGGQLKELDFSQNTLLEKIYCECNQLTKIDVSANANLSRLECQLNHLNMLDISKNAALEYLYCYDNNLSSLNVSSNRELIGLNCDANTLTSLDISNNMELNWLCCAFNRLTSLKISNNLKLKELQCYYNQLTNLDISKNTELTELDCFGNELASLDVSNNLKLKGLRCYINQLTSLDVSKNTELTYLSCSNNNLSSLDVSKNTKLLSLGCDGNNLSRLDVSKNTKLTSLYCWQNDALSLWLAEGQTFSEGFTYNSESTTINGKAVAVDMGLSVKWANCDIGASGAFEEGDFFAWAELSTKDDFTFKNYKYIAVPPGVLDSCYHYTKYAVNVKLNLFHHPDGKTHLDPYDDAAIVRWKSYWRMPTANELNELIENCDWYWTERGGHPGYSVTSRITGNSIFFPADTRAPLIRTHYWTSDLQTDSNGDGGDCAYTLYFFFQEYKSLYSSREAGHFIRPVWDDSR